MKKRLEAELISIAHRILKLKNKSEVDQLYKETQKLYETLSVLKFYQDNFEAVKSDVPKEVLEEKLTQAPATETPKEEVSVTKENSGDSEEAKQVTEPVAAVEPEVEPEPEVKEEAEEDPSESELEEQIVVSEEPEPTVEAELEEEPAQEEEIIAEIRPSFEPIFELEAEELPAEISFEVQPEEKLEDHIGNYTEPVFVKPDEVSLFPSEVPAETREELKAAIPTETPKAPATHDGMSKSIAIGLNDRIGFVQHLFNDSNEDFNRVISQLNTFDTFEEAKNFINEMVIPDYNYWVGEEDYIERFMAIVEKKFQ